MRDYTNLNWPDGPFGAEFRPFGKPSKMLASVAVDWADRDTGTRLPVCASVVYLRVKPAQTLPVEEHSLSIGFRTTVIETTAEIDEQVSLFDRCLVGARRHATIMAGHRLEDDLARLDQVAGRRLPGVAGIREAWADRSVKGRGLATMVDTSQDLNGEPPPLDVPLDSIAVPIPATSTEIAQAARNTLTRCLAIALTAAVHTDRMSWTDTFHASVAVAAAAWDMFDPDARHASAT